MNEKWFIRGPQPVVDKTYVRNMIYATQFFMRWYKANDGIPFRNMLKHMHWIVSHNYQGYTNSNYMVKISNNFRGEPDSSWHPILKKEWFTGIGDEKNIRPVVSFVIPQMSHYLENTEDGYVLHLPDSKYVCIYLLLMETIMMGIQHRKPLDLRLLAAYIQLFVVGHPFEKINFSICMAQVNAVLDIHGYEVIYHGWLDFECFMYDHHRVAEIFKNKICKRVS